MNNKLIKLLLYIAIGLCLVIAAEWLYASYSRQQLLTSIGEAKVRSNKPEELPQIELNKQQEESYADLVARPLFIKGRRAVDEPPRSEVEQGSVKPESFDWQLSGVYGVKKNVSGLFSRSKPAGKDNFRKITVGEELDGWKLVEIDKDRALLKQGNKEKELLLRKPKPKNSSQQTNKPAPPPAPAPVVIPEQGEDNTKDTSESSQ
jgi:hypothetical protein